VTAAYSTLKALRHLDVIQDIRRGHATRPVHVQVILSDLCNQACDFCAYRDPSYSSSQRFFEINHKHAGAALRRDTAHPERNYNPNRMIQWPKVQEILDDCAAMGVQAVQFTGGGEPTVHPHWHDAIAYAQTLGLRTALVTNGVNIGRTLNDAGARVASECDWVRVSIDAATRETYTAIRNVPESHFDAAWRAVRSLRQHRRDLVLGVGFVVTPQNWREIYDAAALAKDAGADNIRIGAQFSAAEERLFESFHEYAAALARRAEQLASNHFTVFNRFSEKLDDLRSRRPDYGVCGYQYFTTYIGADLNVYRCCVTAYNDTGALGSIKDQRFRDLWMSPERVESMAEFHAQSCDRCQFNAQNRVLDYVLRAADPTHHEFV